MENGVCEIFEEASYCMTKTMYSVYNFFHECQLFIFRLRSSQNVALIQYRIPRNSQGFIFRVSYATNDDRKYYLYTMTLLK